MGEEPGGLEGGGRRGVRGRDNVTRNLLKRGVKRNRTEPEPNRLPAWCGAIVTKPTGTVSPPRTASKHTAYTHWV